MSKQLQKEIEELERKILLLQECKQLKNEARLESPTKQFEDDCPIKEKIPFRGLDNLSMADSQNRESVCSSRVSKNLEDEIKSESKSPLKSISDQNENEMEVVLEAPNESYSEHKEMSDEENKMQAEVISIADTSCKIQSQIFSQNEEEAEEPRSSPSQSEPDQMMKQPESPNKLEKLKTIIQDVNAAEKSTKEQSSWNQRQIVDNLASYQQAKESQEKRTESPEQLQNVKAKVSPMQEREKMDQVSQHTSSMKQLSEVKIAPMVSSTSMVNKFTTQRVNVPS